MVKEADEVNKQRRVGVTVRRDGLLPPPVGTSDWATFTRPRRFGKSKLRKKTALAALYTMKGRLTQ